MKQRITEKQYNEITEEQKETWYRFALEKRYTFVDEYPMWADSEGWDVDRPQLLGFPSIGEMIEFLSEKKGLGMPDHAGNALVWPMDKELCDVLWKNVKEVI